MTTVEYEVEVMQNKVRKQEARQDVLRGLFEKLRNGTWTKSDAELLEQLVCEKETKRSTSVQVTRHKLQGTTIALLHTNKSQSK